MRIEHVNVNDGGQAVIGNVRKSHSMTLRAEQTRH